MLAAGAHATAWLGTGQRLVDWVPWLTGSLQISRGYSAAMSLEGRLSDPLVAVFVMGLLGITLLERLFQEWNLRRCIELLIVPLFVALWWKNGFIRQDTGHLVMFFGSVAPFAVFLAGGIRFEPSRPEPRARASVVALLTAGFLCVVWEARVFALSGQQDSLAGEHLKAGRIQSGSPQCLGMTVIVEHITIGSNAGS